GPVGGGVAGLTTNAGGVICLHAIQGVDISHCSASALLLLFASDGDVSMSSAGIGWQLLDVPTWVRPNDAFDLRLAENSQLVIMKPAHEPFAVSPSPGVHQLPAMAPLIKRYLENIRFYVDDTHAKALTRELLGQLARLEAGGQIPVIRNAAPPDRRLLRAIDKIEENPSWKFNLQELASYSGVSERNLYYLLKEGIGMTPYRFYQRQRLIRVRQRLVDYQAGEPHISRYAADEGFSHLGRFAALYREHFGELPSKTIRCRQLLCGAEADVDEVCCE
ncbi:MAG: helix-turn-helix transcriptional regulator, partial [Marinobacter sp.]|uniref:AraC family transcriptional regulator n=2 Tax=Marinobacter TaxID=2742 RepID=UPI001B79491A